MNAIAFSGPHWTTFAKLDDQKPTTPEMRMCAHTRGFVDGVRVHVNQCVPFRAWDAQGG